MENNKIVAVLLWFILHYIYYTMIFSFISITVLLIKNANINYVLYCKATFIFKSRSSNLFSFQSKNIWNIALSSPTFCQIISHPLILSQHSVHISLWQLFSIGIICHWAHFLSCSSDMSTNLIDLFTSFNI